MDRQSHIFFFFFLIINLLHGVQRQTVVSTQYLLKYIERKKDERENEKRDK